MVLNKVLHVLNQLKPGLDQIIQQILLLNQNIDRKIIGIEFLNE
jgi:hypothetical protein